MSSELRPTSQRIEAFSDAVFAIVATIMMFDIRIPDALASSSDAATLNGVVAIVGTYGVSYLVIMTLWISHHYLILIIPRPDRSVMWLNSLLLFFVSLIPMASRFLGSHPASARAVSWYGLVLLLCTAAFGVLRLRAARISEDDFHRSIHRQVLRRIWMTVAVYALSILLSFWNVRLAWAGFLITPLMFFLPVVRVSRHPRPVRS